MNTTAPSFLQTNLRSLSHRSAGWIFPMLQFIPMALGTMTALAGADGADAGPVIEDAGSKQLVARSAWQNASSDLRFGANLNRGTLHRTYSAGGTGDQSVSYQEFGPWVSYTSSFSDKAPAWRWEWYATGAQAKIKNPSSTGDLLTATSGLGAGYAVTLVTTDSFLFLLEGMPFLGGGYADYKNEYPVSAAGLRGDAKVSANGWCLEGGLKANAVLLHSSGLELAAQVGWVMKRTSLNGNTSSTTTTGTKLTSDYQTTDTLNGYRFGVFLGWRF